MPHKTSPLTILDHRFLEVSVLAEQEPADDSQYDLQTEIEVGLIDESEPLNWSVLLRVSFGPHDPDIPTPYSGQVAVSGSFEISESFSEENREALIRVSAASILYGACRETVANLTARSVNGILSLPSISFRKERSNKE